MKTLVVLESGTKTTYFKKYLDTNKYIIDACYGHIRDLEQKKMSIDIENNFKPTYKIISSKKNIISGLEKKCPNVIVFFLRVTMTAKEKAYHGMCQKF